jgi:CRISPR-associated protein Csm1
MNQREYRTLILAGLLHDVGKFVQKPTGRSRNHPEDSALFVERQAELLSRWDVDLPLLLDLLRYHQGGAYRERMDPVHVPAAALISQADHHSSGERTPEPREDTEEIRGYMPLACTFAGVDLGFADPVRPPGYRPRTLHPVRAFPTLAPGARIEADEIRQTISDFERAYATILEQSSTFDVFVSSLLTLLERYTWATPSDVSRPDISIYDHLRTTCALTACLTLYHDARGTLHDLAAIQDQGDAQLLLIEGSLGGIQEYLYSITQVGAGGVAKRLRARSFFLTALTDVVAHRLLQDLLPGQQLPGVCRLMSKGGRFTLLAPNLPAAVTSLQRLAGEINGWLLREFHGSLTFTFASVAMTGDGFGLAGIGEKFRGLEDAYAGAKAHRLSAVLTHDGAWQTEDFVQGHVHYSPGEGACCSCNKLPAQAGREYLCPRCDHQRQIAERLLTARYLAYSRGPASPDPRRSLGFFEGDDCFYVTLADKLDDIPAEPEPYLVEGLLEPGSEELIEAAWKYPYADRYLANYVARFRNERELKDLCARCPEGRREDGPCDYLDDALRQLRQRGVAMYSFGCIAAESSGWPLIGLLKADVDRLGIAFGQGLGTRDSLSRRATMSRMVDLFFGGWLDHALATTYRACYTVYAGGDDLLIVGPWDQLIDLSQAIDTAFHEFTAANGNLTLSAGLAFVKPRYPIARAVEYAEEALEDSKNGEPEQEGAWRDRLTVLGHTLQWKELPGVMADVNALKDTDPTSAFLYNLAHYADLYQRYRHDGNVGGLRYKPLLAYDIARNLKSGDRRVRAWADDLMQSLHGVESSPRMDHLGLVARYVQLTRRRRGID